MSEGTASNAYDRINVDQYITLVPSYRAKDLQTLKVKQGANSFEFYAIRDQNIDKPELFYIAIQQFQHA